MDIFDTLKDIIAQITKLGPEGLTIAACWMFGYIIRKIPAIDNKIIPILCPLLGMLIYPLLANPEAVSKDVRNPVVATLVIGFILGFLSWTIHKALFKGLEKKFPAISKWFDGYPEEEKVDKSPTDSDNKIEEKKD